jgi:hypothetical protein
MGLDKHFCWDFRAFLCEWIQVAVRTSLSLFGFAPAYGSEVRRFCGGL